ncbi:MAG: OmpA family protein, partial [Pseudomonadota bacterium]
MITRGLTIGLVLLAGGAVAEDVPGSADHPLVGRFEGSFIQAYDTKEFDAVSYAFAPGELETREGVVTRLSYAYPEGIALLQVARNFTQALEGKGFEIRLDCDAKACNRISYDVEQFGNSPVWADAFNYRYVSATRESADGVAHASLFLSENNGRVLSVVAVTEEEAMAFKMIEAAEMAEAVADTGRIALYGILFDTDEAEIKPQSAPTLAEMATFLKGNPELSVVIVGHTDNQGSMEYNLGLSARRAEAVRNALVAEHGISAERMAHAGAGFFAPV